MSLFSLFEQETVINYNAAEKLVSLYTRDRTVMRKLDKLVSECPSVYQLVSETDIDKTYSFPKNLISFRKPKILSAEHLEKSLLALKVVNSRKGGAHHGA